VAALRGPATLGKRWSTGAFLPSPLWTRDGSSLIPRTASPWGWGRGRRHLKEDKGGHIFRLKSRNEQKLIEVDSEMALLVDV
jgi:hypothetical protein